MSQSRPRRFDGDRRERKSGSLLGAIARQLVSWGSLVVLLYFLGVIPSFWHRQLNAPEDVQAAAANVEVVTTASIHKQQLATAKFNQNQILASYEDVKRAIDDWERDLAAWEQEGPPLLKSEAGKRIATDPEQLKRYRGIIQAIRPGKKDIATARRAAEDLIKPVRDALSNPQDASNPDAGIATALQGLQANAVKAKNGYRDATDAVLAMLDAVKDKAPQEKTLEAAIAALDQEEANTRAALIDAAVKKAKEEGANRVAEAKVSLEKEIFDKEAARIRNEAALKKLETDHQAAKHRDELAVMETERQAEAKRLRDLAEQKRQGDFYAGAVWKGRMLQEGVYYENATMTITGRINDDVTGRIAYNKKGENFVITFEGQITENAVMLMPTSGYGYKFTCTHNAAAKTLVGASSLGSASASFTFRLAPKEAAK